VLQVPGHQAVANTIHSYVPTAETRFSVLYGPGLAGLGWAGSLVGCTGDMRGVWGVFVVVRAPTRERAATAATGIKPTESKGF
jgi:hypothetical protein